MGIVPLQLKDAVRRAIHKIEGGRCSTHLDSMLLILNSVGCNRRMMAADGVSLASRSYVTGIHHTHLTCSLIRVVSPTSLSSSHFPKKSSPKKGLRGFFSLPSFSLRLQYCWWSVVRNHFKTKSALFAGSGSLAGAMKIAGCSAQYAEYSTSDVEERMKGGAVREDRSPLKDAMDYGGGSQQSSDNYTAEHQSC